jgi:hypothetical protein
MKIQGNAFHFAKEADASDAKFPDFFGWLNAQQASPSVTWPPHKIEAENTVYRRQLFVNVSADLYYGVVLSARKTEYQHFVDRTGGTIKIVTKHNGGNPPVEVNCFCVKRGNGKGIYTHYHGSYAFMSFLGDLWGSYRHFVKHQQGEAAGNVDGDADDYEKKLKAVNKSYSLHKRAAWSPMFTPAGFDKLVGELNEVHEVRLTTYEAPSANDAPMNTRISSVHQTYRMNGAQRVDSTFKTWLKHKKDAATRLLKSGKKSISGSVAGVDANNKERVIYFDENIENLMDYDYDAIGTFEVDNLIKNPCIDELVKLVRAGIMFR